MTSKQKIAGIMGPGEGAGESVLQLSFECGKACAEAGYWVLTGGRKAGVMDAALRGAKEAGGKTIGILPDDAFDPELHSEHIDVPILTGMGQARNVINVLTSDVIIAIGMGAGTLSEISLAIKHGKKVLIMNADDALKALLLQHSDEVLFCQSVSELKRLL
jgi:hypothetical protein